MPSTVLPKVRVHTASSLLTGHVQSGERDRKDRIQCHMLHASAEMG